MSSTKDFYKVSAVVDHWLIENELPNSWFPKGLAFCLRGLRELNLDSWNDIKTSLLDVTDRKTAVLPPDFVDWTKVALRYGQYAICLGQNNDLNELDRVVNEVFVRGLPKYYLPNGVNFSNYSTMPYANYQGMTLDVYGCGFITKGSFKVRDTGTCKELLLDFDFGASQIYLEYITDGFDPCGETVIHPYIYDYLVKYIDARYEDKCNPEATEASIYRRNREVIDAERKVRARNSNIDPTTLLNLTRQYTTLALKM